MDTPQQTSESVRPGTYPEIAEAVAHAHDTFAAARTKPVCWRLAQLKSLETMLTHQRADFEAALQHDLAKNPTESWLTEIGFVIEEIRHIRKHLEGWLAPRRARVPLNLKPATASTMYEPLGVVLVIAPWNYPLQLLLSPIAGALAAGNAIIAKPSEFAPATAAAIAEYLPAYLDDGAVTVVQGGPDATTELLNYRFDHILYTGNGRIGRIVMAAASKHLTPVTLELGGKSPVYVDESADLRVAATRIAWGKFLNAGQTCVAPDYVLARRRVLDELSGLIAESVERLFGSDMATSTSYGRIVNDRHFQRLCGYLPDVSSGFGDPDPDTRFIPPTLLDRAALTDPVMAEEVFGPILPMIEVSGPEDAVHVIDAGDKPLSLYVFTTEPATRHMFTYGTSSGAIAFNVPVAHLNAPELPFGGVGDSGMGRYHGKYSLQTFSHEKTVFSKPAVPDTLGMVYPPYTKVKDMLIRRLIAPFRASKGR